MEGEEGAAEASAEHTSRPNVFIGITGLRSPPSTLAKQSRNLSRGFCPFWDACVAQELHNATMDSFDPTAPEPEVVHKEPFNGP
jgi:hypothetical protein